MKTMQYIMHGCMSSLLYWLSISAVYSQGQAQVGPLCPLIKEISACLVHTPLFKPVAHDCQPLKSYHGAPS